ncbi:MAG: amino acid adenylation protein [Gammaproteobacteria bacterium]|jgi:amino acid adenylation domain-containing protein|nr:amino acid adenylation protein [Gammaproteobacteria bacterium]
MSNVLSYPLTPLQKSLLKLSLLNAKLYITQVVVELSLHLDPVVCEMSIQAVVKKYPFLLGKIQEESLVVEENSKVPFKFYDLVKHKSAQKRLKSIIGADSEKGFLPFSSPLIRFTLIRIGSKKTCLLFTHHHLLLDATSFERVITDILHSYFNARKGAANFAQNEYQYFTLDKNKKSYSESCHYWQNELKKTCSMDFIVSKSAVASLKTFKTIHFQSSPQITQKIDKASQAHTINQNAFFQTIFALVVAKYSFSKKLTLGVTRRFPYAKTKNCLGLLINTLPVNIDFSEKTTLLSAIKKVRRKNQALRKHINYFICDHISEDSEYENFSILYDYKTESFYEKLKKTFGNIILNAYFNLKTEYPLNIEVSREGKVFSFRLNYYNNCIGTSLIKKIINSFLSLLYTSIENFSTKINKISLIQDKEYEEQHKYFKRQALPKVTLLHKQFEMVAKMCPQKTAIIYEDVKYTYEKLDVDSSIFADYLAKEGVLNHQTVAMCMDRSYELVVSAIAILKVGASSLSLDPLQPDERVKVILKASQVSFIVIDKKYQQRFEALKQNVKLIFVDIKEFPKSNSFVSKPVPENSISQIVFTSGSTGAPKGVILKHKGIFNTIYSIQKIIKVSPKDKCISVASISFDMFIMDIWLPLLSGAVLVLPKEDDIRQPKKIAEYIDKYKITFFEATPAYLQKIVSYFKRPCAGLKILSGGEVLTTVLARELGKYGIVYNLYGPTENSIYSTVEKVNNPHNISLGHTIHNVHGIVIDHNLNILPRGAVGELCLSGDGLMQGYINLPKNSQFFLKNWPFLNKKELFYKTGDIVYQKEDGKFVYFGRADFQTKISGNLVNLNEIIKKIEEIDVVDQAVVSITTEANYKKQVIAYIKLKDKFEPSQKVRLYISNYLYSVLPHFMIPHSIFFINEIPLTVNGKVNYRLLDKEIRPYELEQNFTENEIIDQVQKIWQQVLGRNNIPIELGFFEVGGDSFLAAQLVEQLKSSLKVNLSLLELYQYPTIKKLSEKISGYINQSSKTDVDWRTTNEPIAIIGVSCCFPDANSLDELWDNLINARVSIKSFDSEENKLNQGERKFVPYCGYSTSVEFFDHNFFGYSYEQACKIEPNQRVFLQLCWEALENAGYAKNSSDYSIGVFAGSGRISQKEPVENEAISTNNILSSLENEKDFLTLRVSHKLNLTGPSISINTACSTSLVAIIKACQSLHFSECDMALAGGISLIPPHQKGYFYQQGSIFSPSGECRVFDQNANGTVPGAGGGVILLKKLSQALTDGDYIYGVIKGSAINNDGAIKVSFAAPSIEGQAKCIQQALIRAKLDKDDIDYIEAHGTGTFVGDPIEVHALNTIFQGRNAACYLGSVKANIGHTDHAAGIAGLLKSLLILQYKSIPPQINYLQPNPNCSFESTPFKINITPQKLLKEEVGIGISSFGMGGTNSHLIITGYTRKLQQKICNDELYLFIFSAKTKQSLDGQLLKFEKYLKQNRNRLKVEEVAYTLQIGRKDFSERMVFLASTIQELIDKLNKRAGDNFSLQNDSSNISHLLDLGRRWLNGEIIDWKKECYQNKVINKIPLPTYCWDLVVMNVSKVSELVPKSIVNSAIEEVKNTVLSLWKKASGAEINGNTNFFDASIDSIEILDFSSMLSDFYQINFDPTSLQQYPTANKLAYYLKSDSEGSYSNFVCLKFSSHESPNLFLIHPVGGTSFCYLDIVRAIKSNINIYAINDPDISLESPKIESILALANEYLKIIKSIQTKGVYHLAGLSLGGIVAIEVAKLLKEKHDQLGFIGLIESWAQLPEALKNEKVFNKIMQKQHAYLLSRFESGNALPNSEPWLNIQNIRMQQLFAHKNYKIDFPIYLFKAKTAYSYFKEINEPFNYWRTYCSAEITRYLCNGNHETIVYGESGEYIALLIDQILAKWINN